MPHVMSWLGVISGFTYFAGTLPHMNMVSFKSKAKARNSMLWMVFSYSRN
jgi:hypothetical protein